MGRAPNQVKRTSNPSVTLDLEWRERVFYLVLENHAAGIARDIRVVFRRKIIGLGGAVNIAQLPIWSALPQMAPGKRIEVVVDRDAVFFANNPTGPLGISLTYSDAEGTRLRGQMSVDFGAYVGFPDLAIR